MIVEGAKKLLGTCRTAYKVIKFTNEVIQRSREKCRNFEGKEKIHCILEKGVGEVFKEEILGFNNL